MWGADVDGEGVRQLARQVQGMAGEVRGIGGRVASTSGVSWQSVAADRFRRELGAEAARTTALAAAVEHAARCLARHAAALDVVGGGLPGAPAALAVVAGISRAVR